MPQSSLGPAADGSGEGTPPSAPHAESSQHGRPWGVGLVMPRDSSADTCATLAGSAESAPSGALLPRLDKIALHAQRSCLCPANQLEKIRRQRLHCDTASTSLFTCNPLQDLFRVRWFNRTALVVVIITFFVWLLSILGKVSSAPIPAFKHYRFTSLQQRDGSMDPASPGISGFGFFGDTRGEGGGVSRLGVAASCGAGNASEGEWSVRGASMILTRNSSTPFWSWYITTLAGNGTEGQDAVKFILEGSDELGAEAWMTVGSSTSANFLLDTIHTRGIAKVPLVRGRMFELARDRESEELRLITYVLCLMHQYVSSVVIFVCAAAGQVEFSVSFMIVQFWVGAFARFGLGIFVLAMVAQGNGDPALSVDVVHILTNAVGLFFVACILTFYPEWTDISMIVHGGAMCAALFWSVAAESLNDGSIDRDIVSEAFKPFFWIAMGLGILGTRIRVMRRVHRGIAAGRAAYSEVWERISGEQRTDIARLRQTVIGIASSCKRLPARHLIRKKDSLAIADSIRAEEKSQGSPNPGRWKRAVHPLEEPDPDQPGSASRRQSGSMQWHQLWHSVMSLSSANLYGGQPPQQPPSDNESADKSYFGVNVLQSYRLNDALMRSATTRLAGRALGKPVAKLDQVYSQAYLVQDIFVDFLVRLARANRGQFLLKSGEGQLVAAWDGQEATRARFKLCGLKKVRRAVSKLGWAYGNDVSQLRDIVRETLYFESVEELEACLSALARDREADIVRVKNTMTDAVKTDNRSWAWAGMPFVKVNLRMAGNIHARRFGVDSHVCELLLVLTDILQVQTVEMRKAYHEWRRCQRFALMLSSGIGNFRPMMMRRASISSGPAPEPENCPPKMAEKTGWCGGVTSSGVKISKETEELLEGLCKMSVYGVADWLDELWKSVKRGDKDQGFQSSSLTGLLYTKHPITAVSSRWPVQVVLLILGAVVLANGIVASVDLSVLKRSPLVGPFKYYRLETMLSRNGSVGTGVFGPGVSDFDVIGTSGCAPFEVKTKEKGSNAKEEPVPSFAGPISSSYLVSYPEGRSMTGWYLRTGDIKGSSWQDPAYFNVWASNDEPKLGDGSCAKGREHDRWWEGTDVTVWCGAEWRRVGAPYWRFQHFPRMFNRDASSRWDFLQMKVSLPDARGSVEKFHLEPSVHLYLGLWVLQHLLVGSAVLLTGASSSIRPYVSFVPAPHVCLAMGFGLSALCTLGSYVMNQGAGVQHVAFESLKASLSSAILCLAFVWQGPTFIYALWGYALVEMVTWMAMCQYLWQSAFHRVTYGGIIGLVFAATVTILRIRSRIKYTVLMKQDQKQYDVLWKSVADSVDGQSGIVHLDKVVRMIGLDEKNQCRQHNRERADQLPPAQRAKWLNSNNVGDPRVFPLFWDLGWWFIPGRPDPKSLVSSVSQLYASSAIANLLLVERLESWAEQTSGMVLVAQEPPSQLGGAQDSLAEATQGVFVKWTEVRDNPDLLKRMKLTSMKRHGRAIEKLVRTYGNAPSSILDIARQCLVFKDMQDLTKCLGVIVTDDNVRVERVKNRMNDRHNSNHTFGYRDVFINLKVINKQAQALGAELTICEVQLLLEDFAKLKTAEGHKRYVMARNGMGI